MNTTYTFFVPNADDVSNLKVGDKVLAWPSDGFDTLQEVVEIDCRSVSVSGRPFVCFTTKFGANNGTVTQSYKVGSLYRTTALIFRFTSAELDAIEADMNARGERTRTVQCSDCRRIC